MQVKDTIKEYWDYRSTTYTNGQIDVDEQDRAAWKEWLCSCSGSANGRKVLDVGTGPGFLALLFAEMGHEVTAVDLSDKMVERARENAAKKGLPISVKQGDAECLPFPDGSFDIVASKYLLWTLPEPEKALAEWKRVLTPGGAIVAIDGEWNRDRPTDRVIGGIAALPGMLKRADYKQLYRRLYAPIREQLPLYALTPEAMSGLFEMSGLAEVSVKSMSRIYDEERKKLSLFERMLPQKPVYSITGRKLR